MGTHMQRIGERGWGLHKETNCFVNTVQGGGQVRTVSK